MNRELPPDSKKLVAIDAVVIVVISLAICFWSQRLLLMTILVPAVLALRLWLVLRNGVNWKVELPLYALCTALGAFNDWNSVVHHRIYDYTVPHYFSFSSIPLWMLLFWGMILRFFARIARWEKLGPPALASNRIGLADFHFDNAAVKVAVLIALAMITRQAIYRFYLDPLWSWLPFLSALGFYLVFLFPSAHDMKLIGVFLLGGPLIEILYIQVGHLHRYHLGWFGGVPLWIVLWWTLAIVIWKDLTLRFEAFLTERFGN